MKSVLSNIRKSICPTILSRQIKKSDSEVPPYPTIISFDDGFKNNLSVAAPILKKYSAPCIFYISSGMIDSEKMFWVDIVEACIDSTSKASITLNLDQKITYNLISHEKLSYM